MRPILALVMVMAIGLGSTLAEPAFMPPQKKKSSKKVKKPVKKPVKKAPAKKPVAPPKTVDPLNQPVVGTWYLLDSERKFVKMTKISFTKYGEFTFTGSAWKSAGTFKFRDMAIHLTWTSVDGQAVKPGTMKKSVPVFEGAQLMQLDRFQYGKAN